MKMLKQPISYNNLGLLLKEIGSKLEAEKLLRRSLKITEKIFGVENTETATSYNNLGMHY